MTKLRERMETQRFLRSLAEARRRYGGFGAPPVPALIWEPRELRPPKALEPPDSDEPPEPAPESEE